MRKILYSMIAGALLLGGTACKKDNSDTTDKSAEAVKKAQEEVADQKDDVRGEMKDVKDEVKDFQEQNKELGNEVKDVKVAQGDLAAARATYTTAVGQRLAKLDAKIAELEAKGTPEAKAKAADFRVRRNGLNAKLDKLSTTAEAGWSGYTSEIDKDFDALEHDVFAAVD